VTKCLSNYNDASCCFNLFQQNRIDDSDNSYNADYNSLEHNKPGLIVGLLPALDRPSNRPSTTGLLFLAVTLSCLEYF